MTATLQTIAADIQKIAINQDRVFGIMNNMADCQEMVEARLAALEAWCQKPPSTSLEDALTDIARGLDAIGVLLKSIHADTTTLVRKA